MIIRAEREDKFRTAKKEAEAAEQKRKDYMNNKIKPVQDNYEKTKTERANKNKELAAATDPAGKKRIQRLAGDA